MNPLRLGLVHRAIRVRLRLRQADVQQASGVGRGKVRRLEAGDLGSLRWRDIEGSFAAMGARAEIYVTRGGADLDRLIDARHAQLVGQVVEIMRREGWQVEVEVTFSDYGDRGSIDILGWHAATSALAVIEVKSELGGLDGLLRPLDVKVRLGPSIALKRFGWRAAYVARIVIMPEDSSVRRSVTRHAAVFARALPARSREIRTWLHRPTGPLAGLWFLSPSSSVGVSRNPSAVRRVRPSRPRMNRA